ncbi:MAG: extracellular solute-binding protein [Firmicutes bacterium]|nr:extracellular solute-binding protein [Bacillota bacterium]
MIINKTTRRLFLVLLLLEFGIALLVSTFVFAKSEEPINVAIHESPWLPAYKQLVAAYEAETGGKIKLLTFTHSTLYDKEIAAVTQKSDIFDIMHLDDSWIPFMMGGHYVTPLKEIDASFELDREVIEYKYSTRFSHEKNYTTADGILYGIPVTGNMQLFFYLGEKFKEAGLTTPPGTWDDVINAAKKLYKPPSMYGYATITVARIQAVYFWMPVLRAFGGDIFANPPSDWTVTINSDGARESLEFIINMKKYSPPGIGNTGQQDALTYMANGQLAQSINVTATYPFVDKPDFAAQPYKVDFAPIPRGKSGKSSTTLGNWLAVIPVTSKHKKEALEFLKWITSKKAQIMYGEAGGVPVRWDAIAELASRPERKYRFFRALLQTIPYVQERPRIPEWPKVEDAIGINFQDAVIEKIGVKDALRNMATKIYSIMKDAGYPTKIAEK